MKSYCNQAVCQAPLGIALRLPWVGTKSRVTSPLLRWLQSLIIASIVTFCGIPARQGLARVRRKTSGRNDTEGPAGGRRSPAKAVRRDCSAGRVLPHSSTAVEIYGNHIITRAAVMKIKNLLYKTSTINY